MPLPVASSPTKTTKEILVCEELVLEQFGEDGGALRACLRQGFGAAGLHEGQSPRHRQEKATWNSALQTGHRAMAKPDSNKPQSR